MDHAAQVLATAHELYSRDDPSTAGRPAIYKPVGICLAIASGCFIGVSFVLKKIGLLKANEKYDEVAGEGYGYLKNLFWWTGMTLMIIGEICNFVAYAFVDAILVTPLGALSVVITTILSAIFLKERLSMVGKVGCFLCIIGSVVIVMNAPTESSVANIQEMQGYVIHPGFLSYAGVIILGCAFIALWVGPRYGKKSMLVYLSICSLIGGLSVVATQGLGSAVIAQIAGTPQFNQWFLYVLFVFVITTLLTEIIYLNKALNLFNAALVTPTYYVFFTSSTIITSAILFRGFKGTAISIITVVMGFLTICAGVVLLQLSKSAKDVPDTAVFAGDLDQVRTIAEQEQPESEPKADAIRGAAAIVRRISQVRQRKEMEEARRLHEEKLKDLEPIREDEQFEWDGLRRRRTVVGPPGARAHPTTQRPRSDSVRPPLGMSHIMTEEELREADTDIIGAIRQRAKSISRPRRFSADRGHENPLPPVPLTDIVVPSSKSDGTELHGPQREHTFGLPAGLRDQKTTNEGTGSHSQHHIHFADTPAPEHSSSDPPIHPARRQFSFQNPFQKRPDEMPSPQMKPTPARKGMSSRSTSSVNKGTVATEEERLGLVKGDTSVSKFPSYGDDYDDNDLDDETYDEWDLDSKRASIGRSVLGGRDIDKEEEERAQRELKKRHEQQRQQWDRARGQSPPGGGGHGAFL